jgi:hypothetical protein
MVRVTIYVRQPGDQNPDFSLVFDLPEMPRPGDYISIHRDDKETPHTEDLVVQHVWWNLETTETRSFAEQGRQRVGNLKEIVVECEMALGPWSTDKWRDMMLHREGKGGTIKRFDISRLSIRERDLPMRRG